MFRTPLIFLLLFCQIVSADNVKVELDTSAVPHLNKWGEEAKKLIQEWYPRVNNLIPTKDHKVPKKIILKFKKSAEGIAHATGNTITVMSGWVEKHPDDIGLVVHEMVHVIQGYPNGNPGWLVEGIADYLRWAIFQGKSPDQFHRPKVKQGYKQSYQVAAGFLLWLESEISPGIISKLNSSMRKGKYNDDIFKTESKKSLDELWDMYTEKSAA